MRKRASKNDMMLLRTKYNPVIVKHVKDRISKDEKLNLYEEYRIAGSERSVCMTETPTAVRCKCGRKFESLKEIPDHSRFCLFYQLEYHFLELLNKK